MPLSSRVTAVVAYCCLFCALAVAIIGVLGVRSAAESEKRLTTDELSTATTTARLGHQVDVAYAEGQQAAMGDDRTARVQRAAELRNVQVPAIEATMAAIRRIHEGDEPAELVNIARLGREWANLRTVLNSTDLTAADQGAADRLQARYTPLADHIQALTAREAVDARENQAHSSGFVRRIIWGIAAGVVLAGLLFAAMAVAVARRLRKAIEPAREQVEFADTLQMAENETEAHHLLQRHLQRLVSGSSVTVLNRNNSADRLEAVTAVPEGSPLATSLAHAEPSSCLAVRSARAHDQDEQRPGLLGCSVCSTCPGASTCTPLHVGGEVIGSVLVNRTDRYSAAERNQVREAVGQAAPVVANLRNLAIAELRAATDSLTGLPNKRAVADTLKRMVAQASRTMTPLSLLVLDLDHFKGLNDRFGHQVGDQALASVGAALRSAVRDSDFAGRNGGEEFAIMLPDTHTDGALATAQKIRTSIADITIPGLELSITASIGIATYPEHAVGSERLERLADSALFVAKRSGRDRIEVATMADAMRSTALPTSLPVTY
jgi:diguanylate cyclase (GGDEF)-like protein